MTDTNGTPSLLRCWRCRMRIRPWEPVKQHEATVMRHGEPVTITPWQHIECIARVEAQRDLHRWKMETPK